KCFGPKLYGLRTPPQTFVGRIEAKGIEKDALFVFHACHQTLPKIYGRIMTANVSSDYIVRSWPEDGNSSRLPGDAILRSAVTRSIGSKLVFRPNLERSR